MAQCGARRPDDRRVSRAVAEIAISPAPSNGPRDDYFATVRDPSLEGGTTAPRELNLGHRDAL
jgi:hypothetical protein